MVFYVIWKKKHLILLKSTYAKERKKIVKNSRLFYLWTSVLNFRLMIESILFPIFSKVIRRWLNNMAAADEWSCQALKTTPGSLIKILILRLSYHHLISTVSKNLHISIFKWCDFTKKCHNVASFVHVTHCTFYWGTFWQRNWLFFRENDPRLLWFHYMRK